MNFIHSFSKKSIVKNMSNKLFKNIKIRNRLYLSFLLISIVPFFLILYFYYTYSSETISTKIKDYSQKMVSQVKLNVDNDFNKYQQYIKFSLYSKTFQDTIDTYDTSDKNDEVTLLDSNISLMSLIRMDEAVFDDIYGTELYFKKDRMIDGSKKFNLVISGLEVELEKKGGNGIYSMFKEKSNYILFSRTMPNLKTGKNIGFITVAFNQSFLSNRLKNIHIADGAYFMILDENNKTVYNGNEDANNDYFGNVDLKLNEVQRNILEGKNNTFSKITGKEYLVSWETMKNEWKLVFALPKDYITAEINSLNSKMALMIPILLILIFILSYVVSASVNYPLQKTMEFINQVKMGNMNARSDENRKDEIGVLNKNFNQMLEELSYANEKEEQNIKLKRALEELQRTRDQLIQSEKMVDLGQLVAGVAHEINTPIGVGVTAASYLYEKTKEIEKLIQDGNINENCIKKYVKTCIESSTIILTDMQKASDIIKSFKQIAVDQSNEHKRVFNVRQYIDQILISLTPNIKKYKHKISIECDLEVEINSFPSAMYQILTNLLNNSFIHAYDEGVTGNINIEFYMEMSRYNLVYSDDGKGIEEEYIGKIFDPFFTTNRHGGGSGLGLSIVHSIVTQALNGEIKCESRKGEGARFVISWDKINS